LPPTSHFTLETTPLDGKGGNTVAVSVISYALAAEGGGHERDTPAVVIDDKKKKTGH